MMPTMFKVDPPKAAQKNATGAEEEDDSEPSKGPNLGALQPDRAGAGCSRRLAVLIVLPFYQRGVASAVYPFWKLSRPCQSRASDILTKLAAWFTLQCKVSTP